jgi:hypothetical protein
MTNKNTAAAERRSSAQQSTHQEGKASHQTGQTNRRADGADQKHERSIREDQGRRKAPGKMGGQGMGQGRGMNPGEVHPPERDE